MQCALKRHPNKPLIGHANTFRPILHGFKELRGQERKLHNQAREKLEEVLQKAFRDGYLQDKFYDYRDGRYLIPVKSEHRHKVGGIVHESSATRATFFMEPQADIALKDAY